MCVFNVFEPHLQPPLELLAEYSSISLTSQIVAHVRWDIRHEYLTFKELLELRLVHVVGDVAHKQLLGVGVADHTAALGLALLPLPD